MSGTLRGAQTTSRYWPLIVVGLQSGFDTSPILEAPLPVSIARLFRRPPTSSSRACGRCRFRNQTCSTLASKTSCVERLAQTSRPRWPHTLAGQNPGRSPWRHRRRHFLFGTWRPRPRRCSIGVVLSVSRSD